MKEIGLVIDYNCLLCNTGKGVHMLSVSGHINTNNDNEYVYTDYALSLHETQVLVNFRLCKACITKILE